MIENYTEVYSLSGVIVVFVVSFIIYPYSGNNKILGNLVIAGGFIGFTTVAYFNKGIYAPVIPCFTAIAVTGFLFTNKKSGYFWTFMTVLVIGGFFFMEVAGVKLPTSLPTEYDKFNFGASFMGSSVYLILIILSYEYLNNKKNDNLQEQKKELEKLSIVASETDNAIVIMDKTGKFQWINKAFTKKYGLTLETMKEVLGDNIIEATKSKDISPIVNEVITKKTLLGIKHKKLIKREEKYLHRQTYLQF